uniref:Si:dkey-85k7.11 n=1 Tax=Myripristis murdjan TaxID=586833 RepID=A0A667XKN9_9TELE
MNPVFATAALHTESLSKHKSHYTSLVTLGNTLGASVSKNFKDCSHFFYMQTPPAGIRETNLRRICQRYKDKPRYATLYDGSRRLPLYSAYIFKKTDGKRRMDTPWMYEPQLVSDDESGNMRALPLSDDTHPLIEESQAVFEDYTDAVEYERGSLNPDQHQAEPDDKSSTYTLTNVVPLITDFLETSWNPYLNTVRRRLNNFSFCSIFAHLVHLFPHVDCCQMFNHLQSMHLCFSYPRLAIYHS